MAELFTALSPIGLPGAIHSFNSKTLTGSIDKDIGPFTELSVIGLPGQPHSFTGKTPSSGGTKGVGPFTALSVMGLPGAISSFAPKTEYVIPEEEIFVATVSSGGAISRQAIRLDFPKKLNKDDQDILEFIVTFVLGH